MQYYLHGLVSESPSTMQAHNDVREYLQGRILGILQRKGAMDPLAFRGCTALRFLCANARYSENLDFTLEGNPENYDLMKYLLAVRNDFSTERYEILIKVNDLQPVHVAYIVFRGLPFKIGMSPDEKDALTIKIRVDTNPPAGAVLETTVVRRLFPLRFQHHDRASLLAGKLHAILSKAYLRGRDPYDLVWYLSDPAWPQPNIELLNNSLGQSGYSGAELTQENWRSAVEARLQEVAWERLEDDVAPFMGPGVDTAIITEENVMRLLE